MTNENETVAPNALVKLTTGELRLFKAYVFDSGNWGDEPLVGGNVHQGLEENGYLTNLKKKGLLTTFHSDGHEWIRFTDHGKHVAKVLFDVDF